MYICIYTYNKYAYIQSYILQIRENKSPPTTHTYYTSPMASVAMHSIYTRNTCGLSWSRYAVIANPFYTGVHGHWVTVTLWAGECAGNDKQSIYVPSPNFQF